MHALASPYLFSQDPVALQAWHIYPHYRYARRSDFEHGQLTTTRTIGCYGNRQTVTSPSSVSSCRVKFQTCFWSHTGPPASDSSSQQKSKYRTLKLAFLVYRAYWQWIMTLHLGWKLAQNGLPAKPGSKNGIPVRLQCTVKSGYFREQ